VSVNDGDFVKAGEALMDGPVDPHEYLSVLGENELARYMVDEVQEVYRLQGVKINDKHIEIIVRQMLRKVSIVEAGDTRFLAGDMVDRQDFEEENVRVMGESGKPASAAPSPLGITKASLHGQLPFSRLLSGNNQV